MLKLASSSSRRAVPPTATIACQRSAWPGPSNGTSASATPRKNAASRLVRQAGGSSAYFGLETNASCIQPDTWSMAVPGRRRANTRPVIMKIASRSPAGDELAWVSKPAITSARPTSGFAPHSGLRGSVSGTTAVTV